MTRFIARADNNKVISTNDDSGLKDIYRLIDTGFTIYRIEPVGDGTFTLIPQQLSGVVTAPVLVGGTLEDVP